MKAGWKDTLVGKVCTVIAGQSPEGQFYNAEGDGLPFFQGKKDFQEKHIGEARVWTSKVTKEAQRGDILMSVRAPVGPINFAIQQCCIGRGLAAIRAGKEIDADYLYYVLLFKESEISGSEGAVFASINKSEIEKIELPLPPLDEQRRIVAVLDKAFAGIATATANAQKNLTNARELSTMCPAIDSSRVERVTIGELLERRWLQGHMDGNHGSDYPRKDEFVTEGVTYLSANCIREGVIDFRRAKFLAPGRAAKLRKGFARNRDVLFAHNATVGPVALLETQADFVILGTSLTYYRCDEDRIKPEYLASYLASSAFKVQYEAVMRQSTRNQVPITKQREFYVDVPPIDEQSRLVGSLVGFQADGRRLVQQYQAKLAALTELKQSLLHKAFAGELT